MTTPRKPTDAVPDKESKEGLAPSLGEAATTESETKAETSETKSETSETSTGGRSPATDTGNNTVGSAINSPSAASDGRAQGTPAKRRGLNIAQLPVLSNGTARRTSGTFAQDATRPQTLSPDGPESVPVTPVSEKSGAAGSTAWKGTQINGIPERVNAYMTQLAAKEARVVDLKEQLRVLQLDLEAAEAEVHQFRKSGKHLVSLVESPANTPLHIASTSELQQRALAGSLSRTPSPRRNSASKTKSGDMLDKGRRMVEEVGTQFWSFMEDVRTAAMGDDRLEREATELQDRPARERSPTRVPNLRKKASVGNMVEGLRRLSPERRRDIRHDHLAGAHT